MPDLPPPEPPGRALVGASYALVLLLALLLAVWEAFLVPLRLGPVALPVAAVLAVVGNTVLGGLGGRLLGRVGALGPGLLWLAVALLLASRRPEGDLVVTGSVSGLAFLVAGAVSAAVAYGRAPRRRPA